MRFRRTLKLLAVDASMLFLAFTVKQIAYAEEIRQTRPEPQVMSYELNLPECTPEPIDQPEEESETEIETVSLTQEEQKILLQVAMAEAEGESTTGKAMVMAVVLNRVQSDEFPDSNTVEDVVLQKNQFAVTKSGGRYYTVVPNEDCYTALEMILSGWDESCGALYFESEKKAGWHSRNLEYLFTVGNHKFYK